jgi:hypothetical protein
MGSGMLRLFAGKVNQMRAAMLVFLTAGIHAVLSAMPANRMARLCWSWLSIMTMNLSDAIGSVTEQHGSPFLLAV